MLLLHIMPWMSEGDFTEKKPTENAKDFNSVNNDISFLCLCRLESPSYEVMQLEFEVDNVINLVPTQTLHWNIEYPAGMQTSSRQTEKVSHLYISNADIQGIVPLAEVREDLIDKYRYRNIFEETYWHTWQHTYLMPE